MRRFCRVLLNLFRRCVDGVTVTEKILNVFMWVVNTSLYRVSSRIVWDVILWERGSDRRSSLALHLHPQPQETHWNPSYLLYHRRGTGEYSHSCRYSLENQSFKKSQAAIYLECWHAVRVNVCLIPACYILVKIIIFCGRYNIKLLKRG